MWTACWRCGFSTPYGPAKAGHHPVPRGGVGHWWRPALAGPSHRFFFALLRTVLAPARQDAERAHLAVQIAALHPECFGRARDVSLLKRQLLEDVLALELIAGRVERHGRRPFVGWRVRDEAAGEKRQILFGDDL